MLTLWDQKCSQTFFWHYAQNQADTLQKRDKNNYTCLQAGNPGNWKLVSLRDNFTYQVVAIQKLTLFFLTQMSHTTLSVLMGVSLYKHA